MEQSNGTNSTNGTLPEKPRYTSFPCLKPGTIVDGKQALNRWSSTITKGERFKLKNGIIADEVKPGHDFPGAQVGARFDVCHHY